ncbi:STAS domain-containing protein [Motiliproteus sp. MSK22-1]|uniref:STAS domain-containing protein n=1 Tax=Motiliproteus sp. MSK22-1 TaxID=1897630 RepID=UPI0009759891|nr:STAS domain-containing protein [Motiliproteus sp. MSK22-1]OMH32143.1 hypothetical protein BGP75_15720 [Motiliproteus sp. MSK22-1]
MTKNTIFTVDFPSEVLIHTLESLSPLLDKALQHSEINLNGQAISKADTAGLQLIMSFLKSSEIQSLQVAWINPSVSLCTSARMLGLVRELKLEC